MSGFYRDSYFCPFIKEYVEGIKPSQYHDVLIVTKDVTKLPDSDRLILEDRDGFRYARNTLIELEGTMVFEMM